MTNVRLGCIVCAHLYVYNSIAVNIIHPRRQKHIIFHFIHRCVTMFGTTIIIIKIVVDLLSYMFLRTRLYLLSFFLYVLQRTVLYTIFVRSVCTYHIVRYHSESRCRHTGAATHVNNERLLIFDIYRIKYFVLSKCMFKQHWNIMVFLKKQKQNISRHCDDL